MSHFVKVIFVQLANKRCEIAVFEMFRKDRLGETFILVPPSVLYGSCRDDAVLPRAQRSSRRRLPIERPVNRMDLPAFWESSEPPRHATTDFPCTYLYNLRTFVRVLALILQEMWRQGTAYKVARTAGAGCAAWLGAIHTVAETHSNCQSASATASSWVIGR